MMVHPPFASPASRAGTARRINAESLPSIEEFLDELPSIDDFIDDGAVGLPPIADFVIDDYVADAVAEPSAHSQAAEWFEPEAYDAEGWAVAGWQDFDWARAASLGVRSQADDEANSAWNTLDWTAPVTRSTPSAETKNNAPPSADEVARALDAIARRIRSGELVIDQLSGTQPEAAMAAALAALLRMRD
jgi:hypothetical protein